MNSADNIERTIEQFALTTRAETDKRILEDAFVVLEKSAQEQSHHIARSARPKTLRIRIAELAAVAAVILVFFAFFFGTPAAKAVTLEQVYQALGKVKNICVSSFGADKSEQYQQVWTSKTMNVMLIEGMKEGQKEYVLWDFPARLIRSKFVFSDLVRTDDISADMFTKMKKSMTGTFGLIPFSDIKDAPVESQWNRVEDPNVSAIVPETEVYELTWPQKSATGNGIKFIKWRFFLDTVTNLPKRVEWYSKLTSEAEYKFDTFFVITYTNESQIQTLIRNTFGWVPVQPRDPGHIGTPSPY
ncbi:MAG: hypothetical protein ACYS6K_02205 [Planctomycetota bacterium]|jgi:hypothetical protein